MTEPKPVIFSPLHGLTSIEDALPEENKIVLLLCRNGSHCYLKYGYRRFLQNRQRWYSKNGFEYSAGLVKAWIEVPD